MHVYDAAAATGFALVAGAFALAMLDDPTAAAFLTGAVAAGSAAILLTRKRPARAR